MPIVSNPTAGDVHVNTPLTNFSQKFLQSADAFVAGRAFPNIGVPKQSDLYYTFDKDDFMRDEAAERADGAESEGGGFTLSTDPYYARVYAYHKDVTDRQRANQDSPIQLDQSSAQFVTQKLLIKRETQFVTDLFSTGLWTGDTNTNWSASASDPIGEVRTAIQTVHLATGYRPNKMLISRTGYDTLLDNDEILSRITGGATTAIPAKVMRGLLASLFELDQIFVMDSVSNTNKKGNATQTKTWIGGDNCLIYYAPDSAGLNEPTAGVQFSWTGLLGNTGDGMRMKKIRADLVGADRIEGEMAFDHKLTGPELGYMYTSVSSA